jgi:Domain of unknown function (DUF4376)
MRHLIYNSTGQIVKTITSPERDIQYTLGAGESVYMDPNEVFSDTTHRIVGNVPVAFPAKPYRHCRWDYVNNIWLDDNSLLKTKRAKRLEMKEARENKKVSGFKSGGLDFDSTAEAQMSIASAVMQATIAKIDNVAFSLVWSLSDDSEVTLNKAAILKMGEDLQQMQNNAQNKYQAKKALINAATTVAEVDAITW